MKVKEFAALFLLLTLFSCTKPASPAPAVETKPVLKISDVTLNREIINTTFRFFIDLNNVSSNTISVNYTTVDGTAKANKDYIPVSGTLTINPNQANAFIDVIVKGDSLRQDDQQFYLQLSSPVNGTLSTDKGVATIKNEGTYLTTDNTGYVSSTSYAGYHLAWADEFDGKTLNDQYWNFETGGTGWGNHELENYTARSQNLFLSDGNLIIEARKETFGTNSYTSSRITTKNKKSFLFGRIDIRAKIPVAKGMWPALWMLGNNIDQVGWPACGETDIMELIGTHPNQVVGSLHWKLANGSGGTYNNTYTLPSGDFSQQFHVFSLIWEQNSLQILIDDKPYVTATDQNISSGTYPFNSPSFFIFNVAVGGDWPGPPDNTTPFPQRMFVDYIRVFQK
ncbi:MAG: family 16 glycosylhydrolase [Chitinophagaceae bacterium]|nr:family 16 glycosylhydrolase [Chitinophagaceae bacterium]